MKRQSSQTSPSTSNVAINKQTFQRAPDIPSPQQRANMMCSSTRPQSFLTELNVRTCSAFVSGTPMMGSSSIRCMVSAEPLCAEIESSCELSAQGRPALDDPAVHPHREERESGTMPADREKRAQQYHDSALFASQVLPRWPLR
jgi:hypothetical protein